MHWIMKDEIQYRGSSSEIYTMEFYRLLMFKEFNDISMILSLCERITGFRNSYLKCTTVIPKGECKENMNVYKAIQRCNAADILELGPYTAYSLFKQLMDSIKTYDSSIVDKSLFAAISTPLKELTKLCDSNAIHQFFDEWTTRTSKVSMSANVM